MRVRLIHWKAAEAEERVASLRAAGYRVEYEEPSPAVLRQIKEKPPAAVVIDLTRLPSHGRDVAVGLRQVKATRSVPLVFVEGDASKVERIKKLLPDATFTSWGRIRGSLNKAIAHPPEEPVVPGSSLAGYSGTPLVKKLGIKEGWMVALVGAPEDFERTLGKLPKGAETRRGARGRPDLVIWFPKAQKELKQRVGRVGELAGAGGLWIAWPKKASGVPTDLTPDIVRGTGLDSGLVDYKVCAIDATYTGLRFARRKPK